MARGDAFQLQGMDGGVCVGAGETWTAAPDGGARWVSFVLDTVLGSYSGNIRNGGTALVGGTFPAGYGIGGITTSLSVDSGFLIVYEFGGEGTVV